MSKHGGNESLWDRFLRWLMPANGTHADPRETGDFPVLEDDYDEWSPEDEPDGDPFYAEAETRLDYSLNSYYDSYPSIVRPYVTGELRVQELVG